jgi:hypothetical protein
MALNELLHGLLVWKVIEPQNLEHGKVLDEG